MNVSVSSQTNSLDDAMRKDVHDRIYYSLSRFSPRIQQVTVRVGHVGGTRSSSQQLCRLSVRMKQLGSFLVNPSRRRRVMLSRGQRIAEPNKFSVFSTASAEKHSCPQRREERMKCRLRTVDLPITTGSTNVELDDAIPRGSRGWAGGGRTTLSESPPGPHPEIHQGEGKAPRKTHVSRWPHAPDPGRPS